MKMPSEEMIEAALSEVKSHQEQGHKHHDGECEFCSLCKEIDDRNEKASGESLSIVDRVPLDLATADPGMALLLAISGPVIIPFNLTMIARLCFLLGMKAAKAAYESEQLNQQIGNLE